MKEFTSFAQMAAQLLTLQATVGLSMHKGLQEAAKAVQETAKHELGTYQRAIGPFPAWESLAEATQADRVRQGFTPDDPGLRSGEMRDSIEKHVDGTEAVIGSDDQNLVYFELGTEKQPPRPVLGPAAEQNREKIQKILGGALVRGMLGAESMPGHLGYDGEV